MFKKGLIIVLGVLLLYPLSLMLFGSSTTFAHSTIYSSSKTTIYTILYLDSQGKIVKKWTGSKDASEKIQKVEDAKRMKDLISHQKKQDLESTLISPKINGVPSCPYNNDFFDLYSTQLWCFANAGALDLTKTPVFSIVTYKISSGNNHGFVQEWWSGTNINIGWHTIIYPPAGNTWDIGYIDILPA